MQEISIVPVRLNSLPKCKELERFDLHKLHNHLAELPFPAGVAHMLGSFGQSIMEFDGTHLVVFIGGSFEEVKEVIEFYGWEITDNFSDKVYKCEGETA